MNVLRNSSNAHHLSKFILLIFLLLVISVDVFAAETLGDSASSIGYSDYLKAILGLVFVIALFLVSTFLFKRFGNGPMLGQGQLRIVDGLHIGNRERLMLVEVKGKQILLAITPGNISKLDTLEKDISDNASDSKLEIIPTTKPTEKSS